MDWRLVLLLGQLDLLLAQNLGRWLPQFVPVGDVLDCSFFQEFKDTVPMDVGVVGFITLWTRHCDYNTLSLEPNGFVLFSTWTGCGLPGNRSGCGSELPAHLRQLAEGQARARRGGLECGEPGHHNSQNRRPSASSGSGELPEFGPPRGRGAPARPHTRS